jgi:undecaprenyl-diphosphatase
MGAGRLDHPKRLRLAIQTARWSWVPMMAVIGGTLAFRDHMFPPVLSALLSAGVLQLLVKRVANRWSVKRPFAVGLCENHLGHSDRGGMPSTHAAVMGCVAGSLIPWVGVCPELLLLPLIAVLTGWARVHAGAHFPSDVLAGLSLGTAFGWGVSHWL